MANEQLGDQVAFVYGKAAQATIELPLERLDKKVGRAHPVLQGEPSSQ